MLLVTIVRDSFQSVRGSLELLTPFIKPRPELDDLPRRPIKFQARTEPFANSTSTQTHHINSSLGSFTDYATHAPAVQSVTPNLEAVESSSGRSPNSLRRMKNRSVNKHSIRSRILTNESTTCSAEEFASTISLCNESERQMLILEEPSPLHDSPCASRIPDVTGYLDHMAFRTSFHSFAVFGQQTAPHQMDDLETSASDAALADHSETLDARNLPLLYCHEDSLAGPNASLRDIESMDTTSEHPRLLVPSLVVTCPTPNEPSSPVFVPRTPITVSKFVSASSMTFSSQIPSGLATFTAPVLPICEYCGLSAFESGLRCAECDQQWLACKVWYRASDGGKRQHLTEPYVKPAESNARNRAMLDFLGVPGGSPNTLGLGLHAAPQEKRTSKWRRFARLLSTSDEVAEAVPLNLAPDHLNKSSWTRSFFFYPLRTSSSALEHMWQRSKVRFPFPFHLDAAQLDKRILSAGCYRRKNVA
ncbi:unnamed protein product [Somion occarium]|uniref:Uncharacterized protein n=1 Tax=Somion occarium TaxID=3059160 RepID=A0ABP1CJ25_9APHY